MISPAVFTHVVKKLPLGICILDTDFTIRYFNDFFISRLTLNAPAIGSNILDLFPEQARFLKKKLTSAVVLNNSSFSYWEHRPHIFQFNSSRPITGEETLMYQNLEIVPLDIEDDQVKTLCLILQDVTEQASYLQSQKQLAAQLETQYHEQAALLKQLKTTQAQLLHADKMASIGQLAAGMAHEINNPLGFINSNLQSLNDYLNTLVKALTFSEKLIQKTEDSALHRLQQDYFSRAKITFITEDAPELLHESLDGIRRVSRIIQNLKIFSHVDDTHWQLCDLRDIIDSTLTMLSNDLRHNVTLHIEYADDLPLLQCQPIQLNQVLLHILNNAVQAISQKGDIWIQVTVQAEQLHVTIRDNGCGIAPAVLPKVFEPFFTTKAVGQGSGLGLSMAYNVIKQHQGHISLSSEQGQGTTITLDLPLQPKLPVADVDRLTHER
ncbi:sensor histidine kinase [Alishewanella tabrizica]|uniref:histidine kinase n=1 Tax=Alishewanella tabrizica TaxID=671278 RepID=A0ABQ2WJP0_9ALTE|nr:ATP-binding protein [Alishewanella tabrizica]GGW56894.1 two-component sensor histidine kinase [Alishewanella tabrizica]